MNITRKTVLKTSLTFILAVSAVTAMEGCSFLEKHANSALDAVQLACIFNETITQEEKLAEVCHIATDLLPIVRKLIAQREAGRKQGVTWETADAGQSFVDAGAH